VSDVVRIFANGRMSSTRSEHIIERELGKAVSGPEAGKPTIAISGEKAARARTTRR